MLSRLTCLWRWTFFALQVFWWIQTETGWHLKAHKMLLDILDKHDVVSSAIRHKYTHTVSRMDKHSQFFCWHLCTTQIFSAGCFVANWQERWTCDSRFKAICRPLPGTDVIVQNWVVLLLQLRNTRDWGKNFRSKIMRPSGPFQGSGMANRYSF